MTNYYLEMKTVAAADLDKPAGDRSHRTERFDPQHLDSWGDVSESGVVAIASKVYAKTIHVDLAAEDAIRVVKVES